MRTATINVYTFGELSSKAQDVARQWWLQADEPDNEWIMEEVKTAGAVLGIDIEEVWWQAHCQGYGVTFRGEYGNAEGSAKDVREQYPTTERLHRVADALTDMQTILLGGLTGVCTEDRGNLRAAAYINGVGEDHTDIAGHGDDFRRAMSDFVAWAYWDVVIAEHDHRTSQENIDERLSDYEFTANGELFK